jgi:hypothetical protein
MNYYKLVVLGGLLLSTKISCFDETDWENMPLEQRSQILYHELREFDADLAAVQRRRAKITIFCSIYWALFKTDLALSQRIRSLEKMLDEVESQQAQEEFGRRV